MPRKEMRREVHIQRPGFNLLGGAGLGLQEKASQHSTLGNARFSAHGGSRLSLPPATSLGLAGSSLRHRRVQSAPDVGRVTDAIHTRCLPFAKNVTQNQWGPRSETRYRPPLASSNISVQPAMVCGTGGYRYKAHEPLAEGPEGFGVGRRQSHSSMLAGHLTAVQCYTPTERLPWAVEGLSVRLKEESYEWKPKFQGICMDATRQNPATGGGGDCSTGGSGMGGTGASVDMYSGSLGTPVAETDMQMEDTRPFEEIKRLRLSQRIGGKPAMTITAVNPPIPDPHSPAALPV
ncbi:unnamed protein product, partial [Choristocarpus tenellus]